MQVEFMENPSLGAFDWREPIQYDVVTCMFAIHYFFASEDIVRTLLYNVAQNLKDGEQLGWQIVRFILMIMNVGWP